MSNNNLKSLKKNNRIAILSALYYDGPSSRLRLSEICNLTTASITMLTKELINENLVVEVGEIAKNTSGRKEVLLDLNSENFFALSVTAESEKTYICVCTLKNIIAEITIMTQTYRNNINFLFDTIDDILKRANKKIFSFGFGIVGKIDESNGIVKNSFGIFENDFPLKATLEQRFNFPIYVVNNVHSQADALIKGKDDDFMFIKYGPGLGCATISKSKIIYGNNGNASEIGHIIVERNGKKCRCGKTGCLETIISEKYLSQSFKEKCGLTKPIKEIFSLYNIDNSATEVIEVCLENLALVISNSCTLMDPQKIILSGKLFENENIVEALNNKLIALKTNIILQAENNSHNLKAMSSGIYSIKRLLFEVI